MPTLEDQYSRFVAAATTFSAAQGTQILAECNSASIQLNTWLEYLNRSHCTGNAIAIIPGIIASIKEGGLSASLGLIRPSLNSLRMQIDLSLAWIYFKDHPVEWNYIQEYGDGYKLKSEIFKYMSEMYPKFKTRFGLLQQAKTRSIDDPYHLLSAHIHGQSVLVLPKIKNLSDAVATKKLANEYVELQRQCSEYLSDIFWSIFAENHVSIPEKLLNELKARLTESQRKVFFQS